MSKITSGSQSESVQSELKVLNMRRFEDYEIIVDIMTLAPLITMRTHGCQRDLGAPCACASIRGREMLPEVDLELLYVK